MKFKKYILMIIMSLAGLRAPARATRGRSPRGVFYFLDKEVDEIERMRLHKIHARADE